MSSRDLEFKQTNKKNSQSMYTQGLRRKALFRRLLFLGGIFIVVAGSLLYMYIKQIAALKVKQEKEVAINKKLAGLQNKQNRLQDEILKLRDDEYIAKLARSEYYLSKDGEIIFNINNKKGKDLKVN